MRSLKQSHHKLKQMVTIKINQVYTNMDEKIEQIRIEFQNSLVQPRDEIRKENKEFTKKLCKK